MTYQPHQSEDVTMKPVAGMNIDEAALKADPSDSEIMEIAGRWFHTGENQHRADGYYYRSLGTPTNVRGSDLIAFARALLQRSQPVAVVPAEQAEDSAMRKDAMRYRWLRDTNCSDVMRGSGHLEPLEVERIYFGRPVAEWYLDDFAFAPTGAAFDAAIDAAIGRNREAGGS